MMITSGRRHWASLVGAVLLPLAASAYIAGTHGGSKLWPWKPKMVDLGVYRRTGELLLAGQDFFNAEGLPWIYPPFAAPLAAPWSVPPFRLAAALWLTLNVAALAAVLFRLGFTGWKLSAATTACVLFVEPVAGTLGFGNLGILLVAAVVLDSMPGPRLLRRRLLPEGWLTGLATAVKLTPAAIAAYNFFAGRRRPGLVAFGVFVAATAVSCVVLWQASVHYWGGLLAGDTGRNTHLAYATNQSVMGVWTRLLGEAGRGGLVVSLLVLLVGLAASVRLHRAGEVQLALCVAGLTSLLASPLSWSHHYVWIVPLGIVLWQRQHLPESLRWFGLAYVGWCVVAPFKALPRGKGVELTYSWPEQVVDDIGVVAGVVLLGVCLAAAQRLRQPSAI